MNMAKQIDEYTLVGCDGNAFAVMGYVCRAFDESGKLFCRAPAITEANKKNYQMLAMSGNYDELLALSIQTLDDINEDLRKGGFIRQDSDNALEMIAKLTAMGYNVSR